MATSVLQKLSSSPHLDSFHSAHWVACFLYPSGFNVSQHYHFFRASHDMEKTQEKSNHLNKVKSCGGEKMNSCLEVQKCTRTVSSSHSTLPRKVNWCQRLCDTQFFLEGRLHFWQWTAQHTSEGLLCWKCEFHKVVNKCRSYISNSIYCEPNPNNWSDKTCGPPVFSHISNKTSKSKLLGNRLNYNNQIEFCFLLSFYFPTLK